MSYFKAKMHQIRFRLTSLDLTALPQTPSWIWGGPTSKRKEGNGREGKGREGEMERKGRKGREGEEGKGKVASWLLGDGLSWGEYGRAIVPFSRYWRIKLENSLFPHPTLVWRPAQGNPSEFLDETYPAKTRGMGLLYGENCMIRFWLIHPCDAQWRTDGRYHIARSAYTPALYYLCCIPVYAVARNKIAFDDIFNRGKQEVSVNYM